MVKNLDYYEKKQYQSWIVWALLWASGFPIFMKEISDFTSQYLWLNIIRLIYTTSLSGFLAYTTIKSWPLFVNKKLRTQLIDEYAKANHYKILKVSSVLCFILTYIFYYFDSLHFLETKTILGIILYCTGVTLFGGLVLLNRK